VLPSTEVLGYFRSSATRTSGLSQEVSVEVSMRYETEQESVLALEKAFRQELESLGFRIVLEQDGANERADLFATTPQGQKLIIEIKNLESKYVGRKSEFAGKKKLIREVPEEARAQFAQYLQAIEARIRTLAKSAETSASRAIETARTARESRTCSSHICPSRQVRVFLRRA